MKYLISIIALCLASPVFASEPGYLCLVPDHVVGKIGKIEYKEEFWPKSRYEIQVTHGRLTVYDTTKNTFTQMEQVRWYFAVSCVESER